MTSLNPSLRLALINKAKSKKNHLQKGFTLVELMVVVAIVAVLSAVALPNLLGNRDRAQAQATIGAMGSFAKQCGTNILNENPTLIENVPAAITSPTGAGADFGCGTIANGIFAAATAGYDLSVAFPNGQPLEGLACGLDANGVPVRLGTVADGTTATCTLNVTDEGNVVGAWT